MARRKVEETAVVVEEKPYEVPDEVLEDILHFCQLIMPKSQANLARNRFRTTQDREYRVRDILNASWLPPALPVVTEELAASVDLEEDRVYVIGGRVFQSIPMMIVRGWDLLSVALQQGANTVVKVRIADL